MRVVEFYHAWRRRLILCLAVMLAACTPADSTSAPLVSLPYKLMLSVPSASPPEECATIGTFTRLQDVTLRRSFADKFDSSTLDMAHWSMNYASDYSWIAGTRTLPGNHEQQIYVDPGYAGVGGSTVKPLRLDPLAFDHGALSIVARRTPPELAKVLSGFPYYSGAITTARKFQQRYGYFEARMRLPAGPALWPAFWLLRADKIGAWPPEIDIMEQLGKDPTRIYMTAHFVAKGSAAPAQAQCGLVQSGAADGYVNYGVLIQPARVTWYVDRVPVAQVASKPGFDAPFYMLVNLAVGGIWPGPVSDATPKEARLVVDHVAAYRLSGQD